MLLDDKTASFALFHSEGKLPFFLRYTFRSFIRELTHYLSTA